MRKREKQGYEGWVHMAHMPKHTIGWLAAWPVDCL